MIFGSVSVDQEQGVIHTHRDTYVLANLTVVSVRRPLLHYGLMAAASAAGFTCAFGDLLFGDELIIIGAATTIAVFCTCQIGQLKLLSRDLRGSELSGAIWGRASKLHQVRLDIAAALPASRKVRR